MHNLIDSLKPKWNSFKESMYLLAKNKLSLAAFGIIILLVFSAIFAPAIVPYPEDVYSTHIENKLQPPVPSTSWARTIWAAMCFPVWSTQPAFPFPPH